MRVGVRLVDRGGLAEQQQTGLVQLDPWSSSSLWNADSTDSQPRYVSASTLSGSSSSTWLYASIAGPGSVGFNFERASARKPLTESLSMLPEAICPGSRSPL